jgi:hypothetical protein
MRMRSMAAIVAGCFAGDSVSQGATADLNLTRARAELAPSVGMRPWGIHILGLLGDGFDARRLRHFTASGRGDAMPEVPRPRDPVVDAYRAHVDVSLIRRNLEITVEERFLQLMELQRFAAELEAILDQRE